MIYWNYLGFFFLLKALFSAWVEQNNVRFPLVLLLPFVFEIPIFCSIDFSYWFILSQFLEHKRDSLRSRDFFMEAWTSKKNKIFFLIKLWSSWKGSHGSSSFLKCFLESSFRRQHQPLIHIFSGTSEQDSFSSHDSFCMKTVSISLIIRL